MLFQLSTPYLLTLPDGTEICIGDWEREDDRFCGIITDFTSSVDLAANQSSLSQSDFVLQGPMYLGARSTVIDLLVIDPETSSRAQAIQRLSKLMMTRRADGLLTWTDPTGVDLQLRVRLAQYPQIRHRGVVKEVQLNFTSAYPVVETQRLLVADNIQPGAITQLVNPGTDDAYPTFYVWGPHSGFTVRNDLTGEELTVNRPVPANEYVEIITRPGARQVRENGTTNIYRFLDFNSAEFFGLQPGVTPVRFSPIAPGTGCRMRVEYRGAWL